MDWVGDRCSSSRARSSALSSDQMVGGGGVVDDAAQDVCNYHNMPVLLRGVRVWKVSGSVENA